MNKYKFRVLIKDTVVVEASSEGDAWEQLGSVYEEAELIEVEEEPERKIIPFRRPKSSLS